MIASHESRNKKLVNNILDIASLAQKRKKLNKDAIDATIGMFYDESGNFFNYKAIKEAESLLKSDDKYAYSNTNGTASFKNGVLKWVLGDYFKILTSNLNVGFMPTPGGTGAISNAISNYLNKGDKIILPDIYWSPYKNMCCEFGYDLETFTMTKDNKFNFSCFKNLVLKHAKEQKRVFFILNDPCHNPTGYCLSDDEYKKIFDLQNEISKENIPFIILYDIAYLDFSPRGLKESRKPFKYLLDRKDNAVVIMSFSASKTFSIYGLRVGAAICLHKNKNIIEEFNRVNEFSSRCKWSCISQYGMNLVSTVLNNSTLLEKFYKEITLISKILLNRSKILLNELEKNNISYYPFSSGFFVTIKTNNPNYIYDNLKKKDIFVIPLEKGIRISLSCLKTEEIPKLISEVAFLYEY